MNSSQLTPELSQECKNFFQAIKLSGITASKDAIATSEQPDASLLSHTVVNSVELTPEYQIEICAALVNDPTFGFVNMAFNSEKCLEFASLTLMKDYVRAQLMSSCVFILNSQKITTLEEENSRPLRFTDSRPIPGVRVNVAIKTIPVDIILAVLIPDRLCSAAENFFDKSKIIPVQFKQGNLVLSAFTLSHALYCKDIKSDGRVGEMQLPNYHAALEQFLKANPTLTQFSTHCARMATKNDVKLSYDEKQEERKKASIRWADLVWGKTAHPYRSSLNLLPSLSLFNTPPSAAVSPSTVPVSPIKSTISSSDNSKSDCATPKNL